MSQPSPSSSPSCVLAEQATIVHLRFFISSIFSSCKIYIHEHLPRLVGEPARDPAYWRRSAVGHQKAPFPNSQIDYNQQLVQFLPRLPHPLGIGRVNHVDQGIGIVKIVRPVLPQRFLPSDVPHVQLELIVGEVFNVESLSGSDGRDILNETDATSLDKAFKIVVLPALSRPKTRIRRSSFLLLRRFRRMPIRPLP